MALFTVATTVGLTAPTPLVPVTSTPHPTIPGQTVSSWGGFTGSAITLNIQNNSANIVYVGTTSSVSTSVYGLQIASGGTVSIDGLLPSEPLYVIANVAASAVTVLAVVR